MPVPSARKVLIRELTTASIVAHVDSLDNTLDHTMQELVAQDYSEMDDDDMGEEAEENAMLRADDEEDAAFLSLLASLNDPNDEVIEALTVATNLRYHEERFKLGPEEPFDVGRMLRMRGKDYRQAMRTTPEGF